MAHTPVYQLESKEEDRLTILHLTDLHFRTDTKTDAPKTPTLGQLDERLETAKIDVLVITGDLADNSAMRADTDTHREVLQKCWDYLEGLCERLRISRKERLIVVPGNHDYRWFGTFGTPDGPRFFREFFSDAFNHRLFRWNDDLVSFSAFDSVCNRGAFEFATGYVDLSQVAAARTYLRELTPNEEPLMRIGLVHHHPFPVAGAENFHLRGLEKILRKKLVGSPEMLLLKNAASFLRHLLDDNYRLLLHGHSHQTEYWRVHSPAQQGRDQWLEVIGEAALDVHGIEHDKAYGILQLSHDGHVEATHYTFNSAGLLGSPQKVPCAPYEIVRTKEPRSGTAVKCGTFLQVWDVDMSSCDITSLKELRHLVIAAPGRVEKLSLPTASEGLKPWDVAPLAWTEHLHVKHMPVVTADPSGHRRVEHFLEFQPPLSQRDTPTVLCRCLYTGVLHRSHEDQRHCGFPAAEPGWDGIAQSLQWTCDHLLLRIRFAGQQAPADVIAEVRDSKNRLCDRERHSEHICFHYWSPDKLAKLDASSSGKIPEAVLSVYRPKRGYTYRLKWQLPENDLVPDRLRIKLKHIRADLLDLGRLPAGRHSADEFARSALQHFHELVAQTPHDELPDNDPTLQAYLYAFDEEKHSLVCRGSTSADEDPLVTTQFRYGKDVIGTAFRQERSLYYCRRDYERRKHLIDDSRFFEQLPRNVKYLVAHPLRWDPKCSWPIALIALASTGEFSPLESCKGELLRQLGQELDRLVQQFEPLRAAKSY